MAYIVGSDEDLFRCASKGCRRRVEELILEEGQSVNSVNSSGQSALFCACEGGHYNVAEFLLLNGALVNYGPKPLIAAARNGDAGLVELLLEHGADVSARSAKGKTAMSIAVQKMNVSVILLLIGYGARPSMSLERLLTKVFVHANTEHAEMLHTMLKDGILSIKSDRTLAAAFQFAFKHGIRELASDLLSWKPGSRTRQVYPLAVYYSVRNKWCDILTELLQRGVDADVMTESCTPLYTACECGFDEAVHLLLQHGANPNLVCDQMSFERFPVKMTPLS